MAIRSEHLNILSICTGGAGLDHGLELAIPSARTVCMVEREAFAVSTLVSAMEEGLLHPAPVWSDATTFNGREWRGAVDGLIGGIPCQPHSLAGRKQGSNDARDLWSTARRIIVQSGAWFVVIENVGGMLAAGSDEIAGAQRVFRDLSKLGFETEGGLFTAAEVGASHQRERIFILAVADRIGGRRDQGSGHGLEGHRETELRIADSGLDVSGVGLANAYCERLERIGTYAGAQGRSDARRSAGLCDRTALVDATSIGRREGRAQPEFRSGRSAASISGHEVADASRDGQFRSKEQNVGPDQSGQSASRRDNAERCNHTLFPPGPGDRDGWLRALTSSPELEPAFRRVADGLASRLDIGRVDRLRMLGNGVVPLQAAYAVRTLATRLASQGSTGAARLVRMMEVAE